MHCAAGRLDMNNREIQPENRGKIIYYVFRGVVWGKWDSDHNSLMFMEIQNLLKNGVKERKMWKMEGH